MDTDCHKPQRLASRERKGPGGNPASTEVYRAHIHIPHFISNLTKSITKTVSISWTLHQKSRDGSGTLRGPMEAGLKPGDTQDLKQPWLLSHLLLLCPSMCSLLQV